METNYRAKLTGVFGDPVDTNPSVVLQEAGFEAKNLNWRYLTLLVRPEDLGAAFDGMRAMHFSGINLTMPHKMEAMRYMDEIAPSAKLIGAINTVVLGDDGKLAGHNTDGQGMVASMREAGISLAGKRISVLGAGGAARAICVECALAGAAEITVVNRDAGRGKSIVDVLNESTDCRATYLPWNGTAKLPDCDIVVNGTNIGMYPDTGRPDIDYDVFREGMAVQDVIFNPIRTPFMLEAEKRGAKAYDGLGMLVHQGAIGFKLWTGEDAPRDVMMQALRRALGL